MLKMHKTALSRISLKTVFRAESGSELYRFWAYMAHTGFLDNLKLGVFGISRYTAF